MDIDIACVLAGLFVAGVVKGATGIGYGSCALPFLVIALGLQAAIAILVVPTLAANAMVLLTAGQLQFAILRFWPLYYAMLPGIIAGVMLGAASQPGIATRLLGALIVCYAIHDSLAPRLSIAPRLSRLLQAPVGLATGVLTGWTGSQVLPLVPFLLCLDLKVGQLVQAINLAVVVSSLMLAATLLATGSMGSDLLIVSCAGTVPAIAGVAAGNRLRARVGERAMRPLMLLVLILIGGVLGLR